MTFCQKWLLTDNRKMPDNSGNDSRYNECSLYHNTMLKTVTNQLVKQLKKVKAVSNIFLTMLIGIDNDGSSSAFQTVM